VVVDDSTSATFCPETAQSVTEPLLVMGPLLPAAGKVIYDNHDRKSGLWWLSTNCCHFLLFYWE